MIVWCLLCLKVCNIASLSWRTTYTCFAGLALNTSEHPLPFHCVLYSTCAGRTCSCYVPRFSAQHIVQHELRTEFGPISDGCRTQLLLLLDSVSRNAAIDVRDEQNLHKVQVTLMKPSTVPNWGRNTACGSSYGHPTSPSVTVLDTSVDAPGHLWSAHHTAWNQPHILQKPDSNVMVTTRESYKQLTWNTNGAQHRAFKVDGTCDFWVIRCWYVWIIDVTRVSVIAPLYLQL